MTEIIDRDEQNVGPGRLSSVGLSHADTEDCRQDKNRLHDESSPGDCPSPAFQDAIPSGTLIRNDTTKGSHVKIRESKRDEVLVIAFEGNLTTWDLLEVGPTLHNLISGATGVVVFDLSEVNEVDAGGISLLLAAHSQLGKRGLNLILAGAKGAAADALREAKMSTRISLAMTVDQAFTMAAPTLEIDPSSLLSELGDVEL